MRLGRHWHHSGVSRPREVSPKPPPGLEAAFSQLLSSALRPEPLPAGLGSRRKHLPNHFCLQSASFGCSPGSFAKQHLGSGASRWHGQGPRVSTRGWAPGHQERARCQLASQGRPKRCSNPTGLSGPSPYLSLKGNFKPFKMASSGFQGDGAKVITAMETLSLA